MRLTRFVPGALALALAACNVVPTQPGILALPGSGKTLEQFKSDDAECNAFAAGRVSGSPAGATYEVQRRYDFAYLQCMYAKGHRVPVSGGYTSAPAGNPPPAGAVPTIPPASTQAAPPAAAVPESPAPAPEIPPAR